MYESTNVSQFIASKIKEYREKRGMTQKELGDLVEVKDNTISGYEHNINEPGNDMLFKLAKALRISINDFFPETVINQNLIVSLAEQEHLIKYRALTNEHREAVDAQILYLYKIDSIKKNEDAKPERILTPLSPEWDGIEGLLQDAFESTPTVTCSYQVLIGLEKYLKNESSASYEKTQNAIQFIKLDGFELWLRKVLKKLEGKYPHRFSREEILNFIAKEIYKSPGIFNVMYAQNRYVVKNLAHSLLQDIKRE